MPKKSPVPTRTEIVIAGQPSATLLAALKSAGERVTTKHLADAIGHLEAARVGFVVETIATGILLTAKHESLTHGDRQKFDAEVWAEVAKGQHASHLTGDALHNFTRSLRVYRFCARHFLADLEQGNFQPDGETPAKPLCVAPAEVLALDTLPQEKRIAVYGAIESWVAGRSLRRILIDFRRAESAADQEEIDEANRRKKKKPTAADPRQMDFYDDMQRPLTEIDRLMGDTSIRETVDKKFWLQLAASLETQAKQARELAKEARS